MNDLMDFSNLELSSTSLSQFLIGFIVTVFLSLLLRLIYIKYSDSVSNKSLIANIFPLFGVSIFLIVITIKSSIVLSLGLVGALSIIRFRTAIKEAEQIVYFLILTPVSLFVRLFGKDLISMKFNDSLKSYWIKREKNLGKMDKQF